MKKLLTILVCISCLQVFSQVQFQKGFIIVNQKKIDCLISNKEWVRSPKVLSYKLAVNKPVITVEIQSIQALHIYNTAHKYILQEVNRYNSERQVSKKKLFLKSILIGEASLYSYKEKGVEMFFFKFKDEEINQLVYSKNIVEGKIKENNHYKQQLFLKLKCDELKFREFEKLYYGKKFFLNIFKKYNDCKNVKYENFESYKNKGKFHFSLQTGAAVIKMGKNSINVTEVSVLTINAKKSIRLGLDIEYRFPFNGNRWASFTGLNYSKNQGNGNLIIPSDGPPSCIDCVNNKPYSFNADFDVLEIPIGVRYYSHLNKTNSLFYSAAASYNILVNSNFSVPGSKEYDQISPLDIASSFENGIGFHIGLGYSYKSKISLEIRYVETKLLGIELLNFRNTVQRSDKVFGYAKNMSLLFSYKL